MLKLLNKVKSLIQQTGAIVEEGVSKRGVILNAEKFSRTITKLDVKPGGTLRFYGNWFGRPYDNYHKILKCGFNDGVLNLIFDAGEQLKISNPRNIVFNDEELIIKESSCVEFIRYPRGEPQTEENLIIDRYSNEGINNTSNKSGKVFNKFIDQSYPAVELLSY